MRPPASVLDRFDLVTEDVAVAGRCVTLVRPRSAEDLIDEEAYARDERLPYWAELWPSARVLAGALAFRPLAGRRVLELGCGVGLPSIAARAAGAEVLATDWYREALAFAEANARRAGMALDTMHVDWFDPPAELFTRAPFDLVAGADLVYEERNGRVLADLLPRLAGPTGEVLLADPRRPQAGVLLDALTAGGWSHDVTEVRHRGRPDEMGAVVRLHHLRPPGRDAQPGLHEVR